MVKRQPGQNYGELAKIMPCSHPLLDALATFLPRFPSTSRLFPPLVLLSRTEFERHGFHSEAGSALCRAHVVCVIPATSSFGAFRPVLAPSFS
eukprot:4271681-Pleurochrysis_carterae.AAC.1